MAMWAYCRVSTMRQEESIDAQISRVRAYAKVLEGELDHIFTDPGVSGKKELKSRTGGSQLLARVQPGDTVITARLDRMFRNAIDALQTLEHLKEMGVDLYIVDGLGCVTNGHGKLVFGILAQCAEWHREQISENTLEVKQHQRKQNRYLGGLVPWDKVIDERGGTKFLKDHPKAKSARRLISKYSNDGLGLRTIAKRVNKETGMNISHTQVSRILAS